MTTNRKAYLGGVLTGLGLVGVALMVGMGQPGMGGGDMRITSSGDGRTAYLWSVGGGGLKFIASARAPKGMTEDEANAKGEDHGKQEENKNQTDKDGDKGGGKGKWKGKP